MAMEKGRVLTGCRARLNFKGVVVGYITSITVSEAINYEPLQCIGNIRVQEHVPIGYECSFVAEQFRIIGETLKSMGIFPKSGQSEEEHFTNILAAGDLTASVEDRKTGKCVANIEQVQCASHNYTINARGVTGEGVQFVCIVVRDESEIS